MWGHPFAHGLTAGPCGGGEVLLERGADIDKAGCGAPLCIASRGSHVEVVRMLLEQGADIDKAKDDGATLYS